MDFDCNRSFIADCDQNLYLIGNEPLSLYKINYIKTYCEWVFFCIFMDDKKAKIKRPKIIIETDFEWTFLMTDC